LGVGCSKGRMLWRACEGVARLRHPILSSSAARRGKGPAHPSKSRRERALRRTAAGHAMGLSQGGGVAQAPAGARGGSGGGSRARCHRSPSLLLCRSRPRCRSARDPRAPRPRQRPRWPRPLRPPAAARRPQTSSRAARPLWPSRPRTRASPRRTRPSPDPEPRPDPRRPRPPPRRRPARAPPPPPRPRAPPPRPPPWRGPLAPAPPPAASETPHPLRPKLRSQCRAPPIGTLPGWTPPCRARRRYLFMTSQSRRVSPHRTAVRNAPSSVPLQVSFSSRPASHGRWAQTLRPSMIRPIPIPPAASARRPGRPAQAAGPPPRPLARARALPLRTPRGPLAQRLEPLAH